MADDGAKILLDVANGADTSQSVAEGAQESADDSVGDAVAPEYSNPWMPDRPTCVGHPCGGLQVEGAWESGSHWVAIVVVSPRWMILNRVLHRSAMTL